MPEKPVIPFHCPNCGREYNTAQCAMYDPPRRPMYDGLTATVICQCISPNTEERTQFEIVLRMKTAPVHSSLLNRVLRRDHPSWEWGIDVEPREWQ